MTTQSGFGRIELFDDFCGPEIPVANNVAYGTTAVSYTHLTLPTNREV